MGEASTGTDGEGRGGRDLCGDPGAEVGRTAMLLRCCRGRSPGHEEMVERGVPFLHDFLFAEGVEKEAFIGESR
jgi:hypothetical protein